MNWVMSSPIERRVLTVIWGLSRLNGLMILMRQSALVICHLGLPTEDKDEAAFRDFETWYKAERGQPFLKAYERYTPPTPVVEF